MLREYTKKVLLWLQKYTKTDMLYISRHGFWVVGEKIFFLGINFFLAAAFARFLSKETYGNYKYILSIFTILTAFSLTGLNTAQIRAVARGFEGSFTQLFKMKLRWSIVPVFISLGISAYYYIQQNRVFSIAVLIVAVAFPILSSTDIYVGHLQGKKKFKLLSLINTGKEFFSAIILVMTLLLTDNLFILVSAYLGTATVFAYGTYVFVKRFQVANDSRESDLIPYGKHLSVISFFSTITKNIDQVLLFHFVGPIQLAVYSFASALPNQIRGGLQDLSLLALPKLSQRDSEYIKQHVFKHIRRLIIFCVPVVLLYIALSPYLFSLFFPAYKMSVPYSQVLVLTLLMPVEVLNSVLTSQKAIKYQYVILISSHIVRLILLFVLTALFGLWGIVWAILIGRFLTSIALALAIRRM